MEDGCIHSQESSGLCRKYHYICDGRACEKVKCPEWGLVKAYEDSLITNSGSSKSFKMINYLKAED